MSVLVYALKQFGSPSRFHIPITEDELDVWSESLG